MRCPRKPKRAGSSLWREALLSVERDQHCSGRTRSQCLASALTFFFSFLFFSCLFFTDHCSPGAGWAGTEAAVGLQGGAAHLCHVLRELRANSFLENRERRRIRERQDRNLLQDLPKKVQHYLPLIVGARTMNQTCVSASEQTHSCLVCNAPTSFHDGTS